MTHQVQPKDDEESEKWSSVLEKLKNKHQDERWRDLITESNKRLEESEKQSMNQRAPQVREVPVSWMGYR